MRETIIILIYADYSTLDNLRKWCILINNMRKVTLFASLLSVCAEHCLRGHKAWARRVTFEWAKTPCLVLSRTIFHKDGLFGRLWVRSIIPRQTHFY